MAHNASVNFKLVYFLLWIKKIPSQETFECSGENLPNYSCHFPNQSFYSNFTSLLHNSSVLSLGQTLYTLHKRNQSKCKFLRLPSTRVKIHQILVIFETTKQFFFKCVIPYRCCIAPLQILHR